MIPGSKDSLFYGLVRPESEQTNPQHRMEAAASLARSFGASSVILFLCDDEINALLPAPGFPQTLTDAGRWQQFLDEVLKQGHHSAMLPDLATATEVSATGVGGIIEGAIVFLGTSLSEPDITLIKCYLPFVTAALRGIDAAIKARGEVRAAQLASQSAERLAQTLDKTRAALQHALHDAEKANRSKDEFLATVSHELRAPLTAILGWTQILLEGGLKPPELRTAFETIERSAKAQAELIDDLLDYGRVISGKVRLSMGKVMLADILKAALDSVKPAANARGVTIVEKIDSAVGEISGDQSRLQQIAWNLLTNAIKFTPSGGTIMIELCRGQTGIVLSVCDSGRGIAPEFLPHVFERFRQADASTTRETGGLGLGLSIVKNLVEMHGAIIRVTSEGLGKGTTFTVNFPLSLPTELSAPTASMNGKTTQRPTPTTIIVSETALDSAAPKIGLDGKKILIVDDNDDARGLLDLWLTRNGGKVTAASSAGEVLKLLESTSYDILVSDIEMPVMDGYTLIKTIRDHEGAKAHHMPAIALSAHARQADKELALEMGFDLHMSKPFDPKELIVRILDVANGVGVIVGK
jgi:signal transduction histidine kinase/ActR/RegA family two-component response regulator